MEESKNDGLGKMEEKFKFEIRATNLWKSWCVKIQKCSSEENNTVWTRITSSLEKIPEISDWVKDTKTRYYSPTLDVLTRSFTLTQLQSLLEQTKESNHEENSFPTILIVPSSYHTKKDANGKERPIGAYLQIETEHPSLWLLHKTDVEDSDSYFEQLELDVKRTHDLCETLKQPLDNIPELSRNVNVRFRFFTGTSETPDAAGQCKEILIQDLDSYLQQGNQKWIIRSHSSVEAECLLTGNQFPTTEVKKEKKIRVPSAEQEEAEEAKVGKTMKGLQEDQKEIPDTALAAYNLSRRLGASRGQLFIPPDFPMNKIDEPTHVLEADVVHTDGKPTKFPQFQRYLDKFRTFFREKLPFRQRQTQDTDIALYFSLAIIAFVIVGIITVTVVVVVQKKKKMKMLQQQLQRKELPPQTQGPYAVTSSAEAENPTVRDHYDPVEDGSDSDDESDLSMDDRTVIDSVIASQNKHFTQAQRAEYTDEDLKMDSKKIDGLYYDVTQGKLSRDLERNLGFPSSSSSFSSQLNSYYSAPAMSSSCVGDTCPFPKNKSVSIPM